MVKKALLFFMLTGLVVFYADSYANVSEVQSDFVTYGNYLPRDVIFGSQGSAGGLRPSYDPACATISSSYLTIMYMDDLSNLSIDVVNQSGQTYYSNTVNTVWGGQLSIPVSSWPSGSYTVYLYHGEYTWYGDFDL